MLQDRTEQLSRGIKEMGGLMVLCLWVSFILLMMGGVGVGEGEEEDDDDISRCTFYMQGKLRPSTPGILFQPCCNRSREIIH